MTVPTEHADPVIPGRPSRHAGGWTIIELMVALIVMAVLISLAYPTYTNQVVKARRSDGHALLYEAAQRQQQFFTTNNAFTATVGTGGLEMSTTSSEDHYTLSMVASATTYTLTATGAGAQASDTDCGNLTLTHFGREGQFRVLADQQVLVILIDLPNRGRRVACGTLIQGCQSGAITQALR